MGVRLVKYKFKPEENEQIEDIIKIPKESKNIIHGIIKKSNDEIVKNAVIKLFEVIKYPQKLKPITQTLTDEYGQFIFGPLCSDKQFIIKICINNVKIRQIIINPDIYNTCIYQNEQEEIDFEIDED